MFDKQKKGLILVPTTGGSSSPFDRVFFFAVLIRTMALVSTGNSRGTSATSIVTTPESLRQQLLAGDDTTDDPRRLALVLNHETSRLVALTPEIASFSKSAREISISLVNGSNKDPDWESSEVFHLFAALGDLPNIKSIKLRGLGCFPIPHEENTDTAIRIGFPLSHLTQLIYHSNRWRRLRILELNDMCFSMDGNEDSMVDFLAALVHLRRLRDLTWTEMEPIFYYGDLIVMAGTIFTREVMNAIWSLPKLETLSLQASSIDEIPSHSLPRITISDSLARLSVSRRLNELTLCNFCLDEGALTLLAGALKFNVTIRVLELDLSQSPITGVLALWNAFHFNLSITKLELWVSYSSEWREAQCLRKLAEVLTCCRNPLVIILRSHPPAASAINTSNDERLSLIDDTRNDLVSPRIQRRFQDEDARAFVTMLESNYFGPITLCLDDYQNGGRLAPLINLHTYLNVERSNKMDLLAVAHADGGESLLTERMWVELLVVAATAKKPVSLLYRVNALFYFLQQNPSICDSPNDFFS